jgi:hypothetical protein
MTCRPRAACRWCTLCSVKWGATQNAICICMKDWLPAYRTCIGIVQLASTCFVLGGGGGLDNVYKTMIHPLHRFPQCSMTLQFAQVPSIMLNTNAVRPTLRRRHPLAGSFAFLAAMTCKAMGNSCNKFRTTRLQINTQRILHITYMCVHLHLHGCVQTWQHMWHHMSCILLYKHTYIYKAFWSCTTQYTCIVNMAFNLHMLGNTLTLIFATCLEYNTKRIISTHTP